MQKIVGPSAANCLYRVLAPTGRSGQQEKENRRRCKSDRKVACRLESEPSLRRQYSAINEFHDSLLIPPYHALTARNHEAILSSAALGFPIKQVALETSGVADSSTTP